MYFLTPRLQSIAELIHTSYDEIWDVCCDHGYLGLHLLANTSSTIHFVDQVPQLIHSLENKLNTHFASSEFSWFTHASDANTLVLNQGQNHAVIIAGVGGELMAEMIASINENNPNTDIDWILCPANNPEQIRDALIERDIKLLAETLVEDNKRIYEVIKASKSAIQPISNLGDQIWTIDTDLALKYAQLRHAHLSRKSRSSNVDDIETLAQLTRMIIQFKNL